MIDEVFAALRSAGVAHDSTAGLQIVQAARAYPLNPLIPGLVVGLGEAEDPREALCLALSGHLPGDEVWAIRDGAAAEQTTVAGAIEHPTALAVVYSAAVEEGQPTRGLEALKSIVHRLRAPGGCPWDREQTPRSLAKYVIEEAYEVVDAIEGGQPDAIADELGDLLLQVLLQAEIAAESGDFDLADVALKLSSKLIRRHPHVFAGLDVADAREVERNWDAIKESERPGERSVLDGLTRSHPSLMAAQEIQKRFIKAGFDWPHRRGSREKLAEELAELAAAEDADEIEHELGDVLFMLARIGREAGVDAERALRGTLGRVERRFRYVERAVRDGGRDIRSVDLAELEGLWREAKRQEQS